VIAKMKRRDFVALLGGAAHKVRKQLAKGLGILKVAKSLGIGLARSSASQRSLVESHYHRVIRRSYY
jgi:hypothetical protein